MDFLGPVNSGKDVVTKEYVDAAIPPLVAKTGAWLWAMGATATGTNTYQLNRLFLAPWRLPYAITLTALGFNVATAAASATFRIGLYNDDGTGFPGTLRVDSGQIAAATTGPKSYILPSSQAMSAGLYWVGGVSQGVAAILSGSAGSLDYAPPMYASLSTTQVATGQTHAYWQDNITGALPTPYPQSLNTSGNSPRMMFRT